MLLLMSGPAAESRRRLPGLRSVRSDAAAVPAPLRALRAERGIGDAGGEWMRSRSSALPPRRCPASGPARDGCCVRLQQRFPLTWTIPAVAGMPQASSTAAEGARGERKANW